MNTLLFLSIIVATWELIHPVTPILLLVANMRLSVEYYSTQTQISQKSFKVAVSNSRYVNLEMCYETPIKVIFLNSFHLLSVTKVKHLQNKKGQKIIKKFYDRKYCIIM